MNRIEVIQQVINRTEARRYLEIGVCTGSSFLPMKVRHKIAVDPDFRITPRQRCRWFHRNLNSKFHEVTSDTFFATKKTQRGVDVVFVDGLHTYKQALQDVENSLRRLNEGGVIVMHDCNPVTSAAAHPAKSIDHAAALKLPGWTGEWCGDVWKTVCHLRSQRSDLRVFVLNCDYGLAIITRGVPDKKLELTQEAIEQMTYDDLAKNRLELLNLTDETHFPEFLKTLTSVKRAAA